MAPASDEARRTLEYRRQQVRVMAQRYADKYLTTVDAIMGDSHERATTNARHELWTELADAGLSSPVIGEIFGRDHSTVLVGVRKVRARMPPKVRVA